MQYLKKPSTYVIGAVAIFVYLWVWPRVSGGLSSVGKGDGPQ